MCKLIYAGGKAASLTQVGIIGDLPAPLPCYVGSASTHPSACKRELHYRARVVSQR